MGLPLVVAACKRAAIFADYVFISGAGLEKSMAQIGRQGWENRQKLAKTTVFGTKNALAD